MWVCRATAAQQCKLQWGAYQVGWGNCLCLWPYLPVGHFPQSSFSSTRSPHQVPGPTRLLRHAHACSQAAHRWRAPHACGTWRRPSKNIPRLPARMVRRRAGSLEVGVRRGEQGGPDKSLGCCSITAGPVWGIAAFTRSVPHFTTVLKTDSASSRNACVLSSHTAAAPWQHLLLGLICATSYCPPWHFVDKYSSTAPCTFIRADAPRPNRCSL